MNLLANPASPSVRKVRIVLHETGQLDEVEQVELTTSPMDTNPMVAASNPVGKIPALVREDGCTLYDSRVICRFLDARKNAGLYPAAHVWETLTLEATGDGVIEATLAIVYEHRLRKPEGVSEDWIAAQWAKIDRGLDALNARWMSHLNGPLDAGQIAVGAALGYLDFRQPQRDWRPGRDALAAWYATFSQRPSMLATAPK